MYANNHFVATSQGQVMRRYLLVFMLLVTSPVTSHAADSVLDLAQYHGKVVYLDFWASWCKPCRHSIPWMNVMQQKYMADGFIIVAVNLDEQRADADRFLKEIPAGFTIVYDPEGKLAEEYAIIGMPSSFLIDRDGQVVKKHQGFYNESPAEYEAEILDLLRKK